MQVIAGSIGAYWSSQMFKLDFIETIYQNQNFEPISFNWIHIIFEPIVSMFISIFCIFKTCNYCKCKRDQTLMDESREALDDVFDITTFITKFSNNHETLDNVTKLLEFEDMSS